MTLNPYNDGVTLCDHTFMSHLYGLHKVWCCVNTQDRQVMLRVCSHNAGGQLR